MVKIASYLLLLLVLLASPACRTTNDRSKQSEKTSFQSETRSGPSVAPIDQAGLKKLIKERNGKALFLNIWATWCAPCVAEFPDLIKLSQVCDSTAIEVVAISADYPDEIDTKIAPFLKKFNVPFRVYVAQFERQEDFINSVNRSWSGALPASMIYDASGKQRFFHVGQQSFDEFKQEVDKLKGAL
jgi:thiol-disulfide isomerase/thioredoxin